MIIVRKKMMKAVPQPLLGFCVSIGIELGISTDMSQALVCMRTLQQNGSLFLDIFLIFGRRADFKGTRNGLGINQGYLADLV